MLRNLLSEVMRRHLWPIPVVALLVAVAAPLLFLKSAPPDASDASTSTATAAAGQLPARAQRLLDTSDVDQRAARRPARNSSDPFQPPSRGTSPGGRASAAGSDTAGAAAKTTSEPAAVGTPKIPVIVITNSDGEPQKTPAAVTGTERTTPASTATIAVTTRFGVQFPAAVQRSIPRLQTFVSDDSVVAIFVKYSPARDKAVFAIAPSTDVTGNVVCRRENDVCRYVDIAVGKHVRLATRASDGTLRSHRLDVVRIDDTSQTGSPGAADSAPANGSCLLAKLLTLTADDPPLARDAC